MKIHYLVLMGLLGVLLLSPQSASAKITIYRQGVFVTVFMDEDDIRELGEKAAQRIETENKVVKNPLWQKRVDEAASAAGADYNHPVKILNSREVNAFCTFDGRIYVTTALLKFVTDDELCFTLAHEAAHALNRDPEQTFQDYLKTQIALATADIEEEIPKLLVGLGQAAYSRDKERRADNDAVKKMFQSRRNPQAAVTLLQKLDKLHPGPQGLSRYFASHPPAKKRIELISIQITAYATTKRLADEMKNRVKIIDPTPFLAAFEKKPVIGYVYGSFGKRSRFYILYKDNGQIQRKKHKVTLPPNVEEIIIVFRNPKPERWIEGLVEIEPSFSVILTHPAKQPSSALALKLPVPLALSGKILLCGFYGYDAVKAKQTDRFAVEFADIEFIRPPS